MKKILMLLLVFNALFGTYYIEHRIRIEVIAGEFYIARPLDWVFVTYVSKIEYEKHLPIKEKTDFDIGIANYVVILTTRKYYKSQTLYEIERLK